MLFSGRRSVASTMVILRNLQLRAFAKSAFTLDPLPYASDALEPHVDKETMQIHHGKHHAKYVAGLNEAAAKVDSDGSLESLTALQEGLPGLGPAMRNNGGGHYNHALFWMNMAAAGPGGGGGDNPSAALGDAINKGFGSLDSMKEAFNAAAAARFGSGWAWLGWNGNKLVITSTANQDNPLMKGLDKDVAPMIPILGCDVWEHAYYLKYQNLRPAYLDAWWNVVNWKQVNHNFEEYALKGKAVVPRPMSGSSGEL